MPQVTYNLLSGKNNGLPIGPTEVASLYFFGIPITDPSGNTMADNDLAFQIRQATEEIEGYLNCKLTKQVIRETQSYVLNDYKAWGYIPASFPVICAVALTGRLGTVEQVVWPSSWLSTRQSNDGISYFRQAFLVPTQGTIQTDSVVYSGITPHLGWFGQPTIPNYWDFIYVTSFDRIPEDILSAIGMLASIKIFHQLGDIILGAGIASQSIGLDGLSQSISTTSSATNAGYGARITGYLADLKLGMPRLKAKYDGITLTSL